MVDCNELVNYCDNFLQSNEFKDYCPNGLQIEGCESVSKIVSGVTACQELIDSAIKLQAELLLVHHGFFWKGENPVLKGMKHHRIKSLLVSNINLVAYHLPLDAHKTIGNNVLLADNLGLKFERFFAPDDIALLGTINTQSGAAFKQRISKLLLREPLHVAVDRPIAKVALCSGAAQSYIQDAIDLGADAFISGEISENTWHIARENNIHYFAAGHHATERYGVQALGEHLAAHFNLSHQFVDVPNPV